MVLNGKLDPRDSTHPTNWWAQQVKMHTLTDFQVYVQNMGRSVIFLGTPDEERNKVFVLRPSGPALLKFFPDNCTVSRLTVQLECIFLHTRNRVQKAKSSRSIS